MRAPAGRAGDPPLRSSGALALAPRLVRLEMRVRDAERPRIDARGASALQHVADDVVGLDPAPALDVAQHRGGEIRPAREEELPVPRHLFVAYGVARPRRGLSTGMQRLFH